MNEDINCACFEKLLCAIYGERYTVDSAKQLIRMTEQADYYRTLPALSRTLDGALANSPKLIAEIPSACCVLIICATKLRNALLFRECMVWAVSKFDQPYCIYGSTLKKSHRRIFRVLDVVHGRIGMQVAHLHTAITMACFGNGDEDSRQARQIAARDAAVKRSVEGLDNVDIGSLSTRLPSYFREINDHECFEVVCGDELDKMLNNELVFNHENAQAGMGDCFGMFFCATIDNEDLPWDVTQKQW